MKRSIAIMATMAISSIAMSDNVQAQTKETEIIGKSTITIEGGLMTPEALWAMGRIGSVTVSPDAQSIVYGVSYYSVEQNKSHHTINIMGAKGENDTKLTTTAHNENSPAWIKNGSKIAYLSNASGSSQVWEMNPDGTERRQLTNDKSDIEGFLFSPDETKVILVKRVKIKPTTADVHPDLPLAKGFVVDDLMYKHWDEWLTLHTLSLPNLTATASTKAQICSKAHHTTALTVRSVVQNSSHGATIQRRLHTHALRKAARTTP